MAERTPKFYLAFSAALIVLGVLFLRETEGRAAAEAKAKALEDKLQSMTVEKSTLVEELEVQLSQMEGRLRDAHAREQEEQAAHEAQVSALNGQIEQEKAARAKENEEKRVEVEALKAAAAAESEKLGALIKDKSQENQGLASELEKASQKYTSLLQKKDSLEARVLELERMLSGVQSDLAACLKAAAAAAPAVSNTPSQSSPVSD